MNMAHFGKWLDAFYYLDESGEFFRCRRCNMCVSYMTKHAVERHGDPIEVMPPINANKQLAEMW